MSSSEFGDLTPSPKSIIGQIMQCGIDWKTALAELIDNAFDAGATNVEIVIDKHSVTVRDDGRGAPNTMDMFRAGFSKGDPGRLGRYGVGLKDACAFFCKEPGLTTIASIHDGQLRVSGMCYQTMIDLDKWRIDPEQVSPVTPEQCQQYGLRNTGTMIHFELQRKSQTRAGVQTMADWFGFTYEPALTQGKQIRVVFNGETILVQQHKRPPMVHEIEDVVRVGQKSARVRAGVVKTGHKNTYWGVSYYYGFRCVQTNTAHGCGKYSAIPICASVTLDGKWSLGRNKTEVKDEDWDALGQAVLQLIEPVLKLADAEAKTIQSRAIAESIEGCLERSIGKAKRPGPRSSAGTISRVGTDRTVRQARHVRGHGNVIGSNGVKSGGIKLEFHDDPDGTIIRVDEQTNRVYVNLGHPFVARIKDNRDAMAALVVSAFGQQRVQAEHHQLHLPFLSSAEQVGMSRVEKFEAFVRRVLADLAQFEGV